jgi:hypothetical protein
MLTHLCNSKTAIYLQQRNAYATTHPKKANSLKQRNAYASLQTQNSDLLKAAAQRLRLNSSPE